MREDFCEVAEVDVFERADAVDARGSHRRLIESAAAEEPFGVGCFEVDEPVKDCGEFLPEAGDVDVPDEEGRGFETVFRREGVFCPDEVEEFAVPVAEDSGGFGEEILHLLLPVCGGVDICVGGGAGVGCAEFGEEGVGGEVHGRFSCSLMRASMRSRARLR